MTRKKKKKGGLQSFFAKKKKNRSKRKKTASFVTGLKIALSILFLTILVAGGAIGLIYMDRYVNFNRYVDNTGEPQTPDGSLKLMDPPIWLNQEWVDTLIAAAGGRRFPLDQASAKAVAERLSTLSWLENVQVQTTPEYLTVKADYRRPVGWIRAGRNQKVYIDTDMTVLDYIPVSTIPVIEIRGMASSGIPGPGQKWLADDAAAGVELLNWLYTMDLHFQHEKGESGEGTASLLEKKIPGKPLLDEIESVDVSNFAARKSRSASNLVLTVTDGTRVYWGAAWGQANVYFEADEKDKLARLYQFFMDHGDTLTGTAKYIELRWPQDSIPRPR
ncbi:MAG: hypothetical protein B6I25_05310 [Planctomycetales bacterium 4572_13]|nr:MAG: hypothetical protein B6I25_05310 [Planctomycetales bacterium 4572_13]